MKTKESFAALLFLAVLAAVSVFYWAGFLQQTYDAEAEASAEPGAQSELQTTGPEEKQPAPEGAQLSFFEWAREFTGGAEESVNDVLDRDRLFIQLYGGVQRLAGRRLMEDVDPSHTVYQLSDGSLTFVSQERADPDREKACFTRLREELEDRDVPFLYVQAPNKLAPGDERLPEGVTESANAYVDRLLNMLQEMEIDTLDLREVFLSDGEDWGAHFFRTDHHWTPEGAFEANNALSLALEQKYGLHLDERARDPDEYTRTVYRDRFLGSVGKRVGSLYGGVDDFTVWSPQYPTLMTYQVYSQGIARVGSFDETVLFPERLEETDLFQSNPYTFYSGGDYPMGRMVNLFHRDGPRILLIRDSYACALAPFLALGCGELITMDLRYFGEDDRLLTYVDWLKPDIVLMMYSAGPLRLDELLKF